MLSEVLSEVLLKHLTSQNPDKHRGFRRLSEVLRCFCKNALHDSEEKKYGEFARTKLGSLPGLKGRFTRTKQGSLPGLKGQFTRTK